MKKALGKGLSALIPDNFVRPAAKTETAVIDRPAALEPNKAEIRQEIPQVSGFKMISITEIQTNENQPRKNFTPEKIEELAASIKEKGILQPIVVKRVKDDKYSLICGERRLRAALLCGLTEIPAVIKDVADENFLEWALIENIQREDLNPIEEAQAYWRLAEEQSLSQDEIAKRVGKDRSTVANTVRLLRLPEEVRVHLSDGRLTSGHARALLGLLTPEHQRQMARRIVEENLSVRQVEAIVNRSNAHKRKPKSARHLRPEIVDLEAKLAQHFGTQVRIYPKKNQKEGRLEIKYFSLDDLDRVLQKFGFQFS